LPLEALQARESSDESANTRSEESGMLRS
jgi:hypothetical protein